MYDKDELALEDFTSGHVFEPYLMKNGAIRNNAPLKIKTAHHDYLLLKSGSGVKRIGPLSPIKTSNTPVSHQCPCGNVFPTVMSSTRRGCLCNDCGNKAIGNSLRKEESLYDEQLINLETGVVRIGLYKNSRTAVWHICKCGLPWFAIPGVVLRGSHCNLCRGDKISLSKSWTHEEYCIQLRARRPEIVPIELYQGYFASSLHRCNCGNEEWRVAPSNVFANQSCNLCGNKNRKETQLKPVSLYDEELILFHPGVVRLASYTQANDPTKHRCGCGNEDWYPTPSSILCQNVRCLQCMGDRLRAIFALGNEEYDKRLAQINPNIKRVDDYINISLPTKHECGCGNKEWYPLPKTLLYEETQGCQKCFSARMLMSDEDYACQLNEQAPGITTLEAYQGCDTHINHICSCGTPWISTPYQVLRGSRCPKCRPSGCSDNDSLYIWLDDHGVHKIGYSSYVIKLKRMNNVAKKWNTAVNDPRYIYCPNASYYERQLKHAFTNNPYKEQSKDGATEFRLLTSEELDWIHKFFDDLEERNSTEAKIVKTYAEGKNEI